jgi:hypothetical protein
VVKEKMNYFAYIMQAELENKQGGARENTLMCHLVSKKDIEHEVLSLPVDVDGIDLSPDEYFDEYFDDAIYDRFLGEVELYLENIIPTGIDDSVVWTKERLQHLDDILVKEQSFGCVDIDVLFTSGFSDLFSSVRPLLSIVSDEPQATNEEVENQRQRLIEFLHENFYKRWTVDGVIFYY